MHRHLQRNRTPFCYRSTVVFPDFWPILNISHQHIVRLAPAAIASLSVKVAVTFLLLRVSIIEGSVFVLNEM